MKDDFYINELKEIRSFCQHSDKEDIYLRIYQAERKIKELTEEICAWRQVVDWATECDFNLEQIIQDEDELDSFIEEMEKKGIDYLDMFNEYAKKYIKEVKYNES